MPAASHSLASAANHGFGAECLWFAALRGGSLVLQFLGIVALSRVLEPAGYGEISFVLACVNMLTIPLQLGLPTLVVREAAIARTSARWGPVHGLAWRCTQVVAVVTTAVGVVAIAVAYLPVLPVREEARSSWMLGLALIPLTILLTLSSAFMRGLGIGTMSHVPNLIIRPGLSLAGIALVAYVVTAPHLRPLWALVSLVAATAVAAAAAMLLAMKWWPSLECDRPIDESGRWVRAAVPMALTSTLYVVLLNVDVAMLGFLRPGAEVGCYRIALQCASLIVLMLVAVNAVIAPRYAELHAACDTRGLAAACRASSLIGGSWAAVVYAAFLVAGPSGIRLLFGDGYDDAMLPMLVLGAGEVVNAAFGPVGLLLSMAGHEGDTLRGVGVAVIVKILLCAALIPILGALGAALAAAAGTIVWNVLLWLRVRDHWGGFRHTIPETDGRRMTNERHGVSGVAA